MLLAICFPPEASACMCFDFHIDKVTGIVDNETGRQDS